MRVFSPLKVVLGISDIYTEKDFTVCVRAHACMYLHVNGREKWKMSGNIVVTWEDCEAEEFNT
jgi:hypothetical protein